MDINSNISHNSARKILFITNVLGGGTGNHLFSLLKTWDKSKWHPEIICQRPVSDRLSKHVSIVLASYHRLFDKYPITQLHELFLIKRYIEDHPPGLVHCYFFWPIIYGRILKRLGKIRFLVENREDQGFNWGRHEYTLLRLTRSIPDRVICVSEAVRKVVLEKERLDPARTIVIHNGVPAMENCLVDRSFVLNELGFRDGNLIVGMVANLNRTVKGISYFLDAIPLIIQAVPEARFLIIGQGKDKEALRRKARALGIEPNVNFAGYREDVGRYYSIMDISVLTSLSEGLSITLLESMSYRLPVVVTRVGGNPEVVIDGHTGYLVPPKDISAFANRVIELLRNPGLRASMGFNARKRVNEQFSIEKVGSQYLKLYEEIYSENLGKE